MKKVYLAIPYSGMRESSYRQANRATAEAMSMGYNPFSPITHSHPLTDLGVPQDWEFWEKIDLEWIDICDEVWVIIPEEGMHKIAESTGVTAEINYGKRTGKIVRYFEYCDEKLMETELEVV